MFDEEDKKLKLADEFDLVIVNPDKVLFEGQVKKMLIPGSYQRLAILPNHTPFYGELKKGSINIITSSDDSKDVDIEGGLIRVRMNKVSILVGFEDKEEEPIN